MVKIVSLKNCTVLKMLCAFQVRKAENNRGYVDFDGIRLVYDFDALDIIGWYRPDGWEDSGNLDREKVL